MSGAAAGTGASAGACGWSAVASWTGCDGAGSAVVARTANHAVSGAAAGTATDDHHVISRFGHEQGGVERNRIVDARRKAFLQSGHHVTNLASDVEGIGIGQLVDADARRGLAVELVGARVIRGREFDSRFERTSD